MTRNRVVAIGLSDGSEVWQAKDMPVKIPLKTWMKWSPEERGQIAQYYANSGIKWMLDLSGVDDYIGNEIQKDYDEYREEMSLGGQIYDPNAPHQ